MKKRVNKKAVIVFVLTLYLFIMAFLYYFSLPIKSINVSGNTLISDATIISSSKLNDYKKVSSVNNKKIKKNIEEVPEIEKATVKKSVLGNVSIKVTEARVLFFNKTNNKYVLSNGLEVDKVTNALGVPTLNNKMTDNVYKQLIDKMTNVDKDIVSMISEIEYSPDVKDGITLDEYRFILMMNDGNKVYINLANFDNLNNYKKIYAALNGKGVLKLDSIYSGSKNVSFKTYEAIKKENEEKENEGKEELPKPTD